MLEQVKTWTRVRILPFIVMIAGMLMAGYPFISNWLFQFRADSQVNVYREEWSTMDMQTKEQKRYKARVYNRELLENRIRLTDPFIYQANTEETYYETLESDGESGIMAFIEIPVIQVFLPIYHGVSEEVMRKGVGHLPQTSFPVGGESTHCVLSAHTGLNQAKLFTDLIDVEIGDQFYIHVLGEILAYKVTDIQVVLPEDISLLEIAEGEDKVTLVTCTPYGINDHRLLVTGVRVPYQEDSYREELDKAPENESLWMHSYKTALMIGLAILITAGLAHRFYMSIVKRKQAASSKTKG